MKSVGHGQHPVATRETRVPVTHAGRKDHQRRNDGNPRQPRAGVTPGQPLCHLGGNRFGDAHSKFELSPIGSHDASRYADRSHDERRANSQTQGRVPAVRTTASRAKQHWLDGSEQCA